MPKKKLKQWLASAFAACLILSSVSTLPAFAESTAKGLVRGAVEEIYSGETLLSKKEFDTAAQAWSSATAAADDTSETVITLYAIWKPVGASTTASIFSYGTTIIYIGAAVLLIAIASAVIYSYRKKRSFKASKN